MDLTSEQATRYGNIIDQILKGSDLSSVSAKQVRKELATKLGYDISDKKDAINALIGQRFDAISEEAVKKPKQEPKEEPAHNNGVVKSIEKAGRPAPTSSSPPKRAALSDDSELSDVQDTPKPAKKVKRTAEEDDAAYAARLQDEENRKVRPTRGGTTRKRAPVKTAKKKKKSAAKVKEDGESGSSSDEEPKERKGGFHKPMVLSQPLAELLGETTLSRPQTVKKIWEYVRARDLQDPSDKRQIRCDDAMRKVFKSDRVHMFTMNKILNQNLYAQDE